MSCQFFFFLSRKVVEMRKRCVSYMNTNTSSVLSVSDGEVSGRSSLLDVSVSMCDLKIGKFESSSDKIQFPESF